MAKKTEQSFFVKIMNMAASAAPIVEQAKPLVQQAIPIVEKSSPLIRKTIKAFNIFSMIRSALINISIIALVWCLAWFSSSLYYKNEISKACESENIAGHR